MAKFKGFTDSETFTQVPNGFFRQLLKQIDDATELKVTLYFLWRIEHMDGPFRALSASDFSTTDLGLAADEIRLGLEKAVERGSLLKVQKIDGGRQELNVLRIALCCCIQMLQPQGSKILEAINQHFVFRSGRLRTFQLMLNIRNLKSQLLSFFGCATQCSNMRPC